MTDEIKIEKLIKEIDDSFVSLVKIVCVDTNTNKEEVYICACDAWEDPQDLIDLFNAETKQFESRECAYFETGEIIGFGQCFK